MHCRKWTSQACISKLYICYYVLIVHLANNDEDDSASASNDTSVEDSGSRTS